MGDVHSTASIKPPVFTWEPNDLCMFTLIEDAESYMEPIDVTNGVYDATFDAEGRRLRPIVRKKSPRWWGVPEFVQIETLEALPTGADELRNILLTFLQCIGKSNSELEKESLPGLVTYYERTGVALTK